ncbi:hypothetical protein J4209_01615 [Candidatus Woesearchaeota archaeon]|nr:hypothetical protein [Candidatus Woesearchaeota archaeon]
MREFNRRSGGSDFRAGGRRFGGRRNSGRPNRDFEERTMHETTCDECGNRCEVPFKPTEGKPVYCDDCFKKKEHSGSGNRTGQSAKELEQINKKLDKIMRALKID